MPHGAAESGGGASFSTDAMVDTELRIEDKSFSFSGYNAESPAFILNGTLMKR